MNPGAEQNVPSAAGPSALYPDVVLLSQERGHRLQAVVEVETGESVNHLEALAQWAHFASLRAAFHLYVPAGWSTSRGGSARTTRFTSTKSGAITGRRRGAVHAGASQPRGAGRSAAASRAPAAAGAARRNRGPPGSEACRRAAKAEGRQEAGEAAERRRRQKRKVVAFLKFYARQARLRTLLPRCSRRTGGARSRQRVLVLVSHAAQTSKSAASRSTRHAPRARSAEPRRDLRLASNPRDTNSVGRRRQWRERRRASARKRRSRRADAVVSRRGEAGTSARRRLPAPESVASSRGASATGDCAARNGDGAAERPPAATAGLDRPAAPSQPQRRRESTDAAEPRQSESRRCGTRDDWLGAHARNAAMSPGGWDATLRPDPRRGPHSRTGRAAPIAFVAIYVVAVVALIPASMLTIAAGAVFGSCAGPSMRSPAP